MMKFQAIYYFQVYNRHTSETEYIHLKENSIFIRKKVCNNIMNSLFTSDNVQS